MKVRGKISKTQIGQKGIGLSKSKNSGFGSPASLPLKTQL